MENKTEHHESILAVSLIVSSYMFEAVATDLLEHQPENGKKQLRYKVKQLLNRQLKQNEKLLDGLMEQFEIQNAEDLNKLVGAVMQLTGISITATPDQRISIINAAKGAIGII